MFSTLTDTEVKQFLGLKKHRAGPWEPPTHHFDETNLSQSVDWRAKGAVNPIKNQGSCGSCWAFGTTAAVEGAHQIATGDLLDLSEQHLVSCVPDGCGGGSNIDAYKYL